MSYSPTLLRRPPTPQSARVQVHATDPNALLKKGIWLYFFLLIFEGALRKWILPGLATPLLVVRDPLALWLVYTTWRRNLLPANGYLTGMVIVGVFGIFTAVLLGHGSLAVAIYGARILLIHFPLMFVIGRIFTLEDVKEMGKVTLWIAIPMAVLIALQFYSPQSAWVNRGVGGDTEGAGFNGGAFGYFRPPGTFSFTTGNTLFFSFAACFILYFWLNPNGINRLVLIAATAGLLASIPLSISRSLLFQVLISVLFVMIASVRKPKYLKAMLLATMGIIVALAVLSNTEFFQTATKAFTARFEMASDTEGGLKGTLVDRFLGGMLGAISDSTKQPFFGYGIGMGTNVGSKLLTGETAFLIAEGEWGRLVGEMGALLGIIVILLRIGFVAKLGIASYQQILQNNLLPWILLSFGILTITQGQWAQPTALGFSTLIGGLIIAALRDPQHLVQSAHPAVAHDDLTT